ncbi:ribonucleotide reductase small subunit [Cryptosporidium ubiquitum]|uniref:Ribonucleotide reductase small subunit n=1 Tax=Cryptosporidium ubiquitum TaxID=857276 RepID=A0A1J4MJD3_9CRYT|nr:ribonucleotide reductase small subunit [Cryptosporidium ubiquitum]OII72965.1 ribonucleotide reductase small subunit [Cryptosporidium ubiquitum]
MNQSRKELLEQQNNESVLLDNPFRWVLFPIKYNRLWSLYKKYEVSFWTAEVISPMEDKAKLENLDEKLINYIEMIFAKRIYIDDTCLDTVMLTCELLGQVQVPEARGYFSFTMCMENIYKELFMNYIEMIRQNITKKEKIEEKSKDEENVSGQNLDNIVLKEEYGYNLEKKLNELEDFTKMKELMGNFFDEDTLFSEKLVYYSIIKKIFSCSIHLLRFSFSMGNRPESELPTQLCDGLDRIRRDEQYQVEFCLNIAKSMKTKPSNDQVVTLLEQAIMLEKNFIFSVVDPQVLQLEREDIVAFILYNADEILVDLKYPRQFNVSNPFTNIVNEFPAPSQEEAIARQTLTQTLKAAHYKTYQEISNNQFSTSQDF